MYKQNQMPIQIKIQKVKQQKKKKLTGDAVDNPAIRQNIFANQQRNRHRIQI